MQFYRLSVLKKATNIFNTNEKRILLIFILLIFINHSIVSLFHFHECDSSDVYKYLTDSSFFSRGYWIGHIWKTGSLFTPIRYSLALFAEIIPFAFIKSLIFLSFKMTYPPLSGFIYGLYLPDNFGDFYEYASFVNIFFFILLILLFYQSLKFLGISKYISFICSFGLLGLYSINSYTYHLGSSIWFIYGSLLSISSTIFFHKKASKYGFCLSLITSYPSLIHFFSNNLYFYLKRISRIKLIRKNLRRKFLFNKLISVINFNKIGFLTFFIIVIFFLPFNSGQRIAFDYRGFFTHFAFLPQYSNISILTFLNSSIILFLCLFTFYKRLTNNIIISTSYTKSKSLKFALDVSIINLLFIVLLISCGQLSFGLTRHSLFILPYIFFLVAIGLQIIYLDLKKKFRRCLFFKKLLTTIFITSLVVVSCYSSYLRFDPLKTNEIPLHIREFVANNNTNTISLIDCDTHYLYNDFTEIRATYNKKDPYTYVPLDFIGKRLLVTQTINEIENFSLNLKKGDELITKYKNVRIILLEDPYFNEKNVFYDAMNFNKKSPFYAKRDNPYSRSNSIYIFPIEVISNIHNSSS